MTAIYLAGRYGRRHELLGYGQKLQALGHWVTSRWLQGMHEGTESDDGHTPLAHAEQQRFAQEDMTDLAAAEMVICWTEAPRSTFSRGGRHVELGLAIAWRKRLLLVGPRENIFYALPMIEHYETTAALLADAQTWPRRPPLTPAPASSGNEAAQDTPDLPPASPLEALSHASKTPSNGEGGDDSLKNDSERFLEAATRAVWRHAKLPPYTGPVDATWVGSRRSVALARKEPPDA